MATPESYQLLLAAAAACEDKKAEDIRILKLDPAESGLTDYFLICNGTNDRQNVELKSSILAAREKAEEDAPVVKKRAVKAAKKVAAKKPAKKAIAVKSAAKVARKKVFPSEKS